MQNCCIRLLSWMYGVEANIRMRMQNPGSGDPSYEERPKSCPRHAAPLTPKTERSIPAPDDLVAKGFQTIQVAGNCVIVEIALYYGPQPFPYVAQAAQTSTTRP